MPSLTKLTLVVVTFAAMGCTTPLRNDDAGAGLDAPALDAATSECVIDMECDDDNPCTNDRCIVGTCTNFGDDSQTFDDGDFCTENDRCLGGMPTPGTPRDCDDGVACTDDSCEGAACLHTASDALCTAMPGGTCDPAAGCQYGASCTAMSCVPSDSCEVAACVGTTCNRAPLCRDGEVCCGGSCCADDGNPCTATICGAGGMCNNVPIVGPCSDGNACTVGDSCAGGLCVPGAAASCRDDGNPCTIEMCTPSAGCTSAVAVNGTTCGAANPMACTTQRCTMGVCGTVNSCTGSTPLCCGDGSCRSAMTACIATM